MPGSRTSRASWLNQHLIVLPRVCGECGCFKLGVPGQVISMGHTAVLVALCAVCDNVPGAAVR